MSGVRATGCGAGPPPGAAAAQGLVVLGAAPGEAGEPGGGAPQPLPKARAHTHPNPSISGAPWELLLSSQIKHLV